MEQKKSEQRLIQIRVAASNRWQFSPIFLFSFADAALRFRTFNFLLVLSFWIIIFFFCFCCCILCILGRNVCTFERRDRERGGLAYIRLTCVHRVYCFCRTKKKGGEEKGSGRKIYSCTLSLGDLEWKQKTK